MGARKKVQMTCDLSFNAPFWAHFLMRYIQKGGRYFETFS